MNSMKVIFRADASTMIGTGHIMRCLVVADALREQDYTVSFACIPQEGDMIPYIENRGYEVLTLSASSDLANVDELNYSTWLLQSENDDAIEFAHLVGSAEIVVVDHYAIGKSWHKQVINQLNCFLVAIDDLVREHHADLIIDQTLGRTPEEYSGRGKVLSGIDYAMVAPKFSKLRSQAVSKVFNDKKPKILISMGGVDQQNATLQSLQALVGQVDANFTVLLGPRSPHFQIVKDWCALHENIEHKEFESDMARLMLEHDIAIGAPGTTSWERACLGLPSILIPLANNQKTVCEQLLKCNAVLTVSLDEIGNSLLNQYYELVSRWSQYHANNLKLCDGLGVQRVTFEIHKNFKPKTSIDLSLRKATQNDIKTVYDWQSHPSTRKFALNTEVPSWDSHYRWMSQKLESKCDYFYIIFDSGSGDKLGVLRLDLTEPDNYLVSIYVSPEHYGRGIALAALNIVSELHSDMTLHATVLEENTASHRLFKKAKFIQIDSRSYIRYAS
ncbi:UDP-2,4-diacetamido-2,4,6-trideoxy-beta-L-altropyranose hydrolase [Vibrio europaeus]